MRALADDLSFIENDDLLRVHNGTDTPVSYTHLDVYKRQVLYGANGGGGFDAGCFKTAGYDYP